MATRRDTSDVATQKSATKSRFRVLARQPLAISSASTAPIRLRIRQSDCEVSLRPIPDDGTALGILGGTYVAIEFDLDRIDDLLRVTHHGVELIDDFLAAIALVEGATLQPVEPVFSVRPVDDGTACRFVQFMHLEMNHWDEPIPQEAIRQAQHLLAHWDGLDSGSRLRRAARAYRHALGTADEISAFQHAYMGLEAMEKPLADAIGIPPGVEEVSGKCEKCGATYTRKRTTLAGVRSYVHGAHHGVTDSTERQKEWREMNRLRQDIFHGLADVNTARDRAEQILPAALHYLHDAICCRSHSHELETAAFRVARASRRLLAMGEYDAPTPTELSALVAPLQVKKEQWIRDDRFPMRVPDIQFRNPGVPNLRLGFFWLGGPLASATEDILVEAQAERRRGRD